MSEKPSLDERLNDYAKQYHDGKISEKEFYRLAKQVKMPAKESLNEVWKEYKYWIIGVPLAAILLFVGGGIYRVSTGGEFFPKESATEKQSRLERCAEVYNTNPTFAQRIDGEDAGVCKGFSQEEIERAVR